MKDGMMNEFKKLMNQVISRQKLDFLPDVRMHIFVTLKWKKKIQRKADMPMNVKYKQRLL